MARSNENDGCYYEHDDGTGEVVLTMRPPEYAFDEERETADEYEVV